MAERILITGEAGFVGSNLALLFKRDRPSATVVASDNLKRRGSELALSRLRAGGVGFMHGDIRSVDDLAGVGAANVLIEASAAPGVHAGHGGDPNYLIHTNLFGAANCLEYAQRHGSDFVFLSTSRVYSIDVLRTLTLDQNDNRFFLRSGVQQPGRRYLFIVLYCLIERLPSRGDYRQKRASEPSIKKSEAGASRRIPN